VTTSDGKLDVLARRSLDRIASAAAAVLDVPLVLISVLDGPRQAYVGSHGLSKLGGNEPSSLCREVATTRRPIVMQDARRRLLADTRDAWGFDVIGYAGVVLNLLDPARGGALAALTPARRAWQSRDLDVLRCFADAAAAVLDMRARCDSLEAALASVKRHSLEVEITSIHDELTGLLNRRGLFAVARPQLDAVTRHTVGGLLLYVDLDGLNLTNDRFGHAAGDELLRSAASVLRSAFREGDTVARLGGDEFVVIANDTPREDHPAILERLALELGRANEHRDPAIPLAWSLGLVAIDPATVVTLDHLMSAADRLMYSAKRALHDLVTTHAPIA
jgi:diguanylate cyclase (GGDEF)-like protein